MAKVKKSSKGGVLKIDMTDVEEKRSGDRVDPGDYTVKIMSAEVKESQAGKKYINLKTNIDGKGEFKGSTIYHTCSLQPQALWNLRNTLEAMGISVPKKVISLRLRSLVGKKFGATIDDEEYEGTTRSKIVDVFKPGVAKKKAEAEEELDEDDEEDEEEEDENEDEDDEEEELEEL